MYWDVVEVKPEQGYCLFARFRDGLSEHILLQKEELTGVLAALNLETAVARRVIG